MLEHIVSRAATELSYNNRSAHTIDVTIEKIWTFEMSVRSLIDVAIYVTVGFMQIC